MHSNKLLLVLLLVFPSCAGFISGLNDEVAISSRPEGARVILDGNPVGTTPCQVTVGRGWGKGDLELVLGARRVVTVVPRTVNPWVFGNLLFGVWGVGTAGIDCITGACRQAATDRMVIDFPESEAQHAGNRP